MDAWDPDKALADLETEVSLDDGDFVAATERIFKENAIVAAKSIVHLAVACTNERLRLDAAKYVVDRNLGRIGDTDPLQKQENDPFAKFLASAVREVEGTS